MSRPRPKYMKSTLPIAWIALFWIKSDKNKKGDDNII